MYNLWTSIKEIANVVTQKSFYFLIQLQCQCYTHLLWYERRHPGSAEVCVRFVCALILLSDFQMLPSAHAVLFQVHTWSHGMSGSSPHVQTSQNGASRANHSSKRGFYEHLLNHKMTNEAPWFCGLEHKSKSHTTSSSH